MTRPLANITREILEPIWARLDIPTSRIAASLGITRQGLSYKAKSLGLPSRMGNQVSNQKMDDETFRRMWVAGVSTADIAKHFGYSGMSAVARRRVIMGLEPRTRGKNIENSKGNWVETISIETFWQEELARKMKEKI